jgi:MFS superfamily sulfate permease-like transporter
MAIVAGVVCIAAGLLKLGFVTELLSKPIRYGYMNGIALTVLLSQAPKLFGFTVDEEGPLRAAWGFIDGVLSGESQRGGARVGGGAWRRFCCCSAGRAFQAF